MEETLTIGHLMKALKEVKLPHTKPTLLRYERKGIIQPPKSIVKHQDRNWRIYTRAEIQECVRRVLAYQKAKYDKNAPSPQDEARADVKTI